MKRPWRVVWQPKVKWFEASAQRKVSELMA